MGRDTVIGQTIPGRQVNHLQRRRQKRQSLDQGTHAGIVTGHMHMAGRPRASVPGKIERHITIRHTKDHFIIIKQFIILLF